MARDLRELLAFRDRARAGNVETTRPTRLRVDLESSSLQEACVSTMAGLREMSLPELIRDYLARGYEDDLVRLGRTFCPERKDLFASDEADEASQNRVARVIMLRLMALPVGADDRDTFLALAQDVEGGQVRLALFDALVQWRRSLLGQMLAHCAKQARSEAANARRAGDHQGARALARLGRQLRAIRGTGK